MRLHRESIREVLDAHGTIFQWGKHVELHPCHHGKRGVDGAVKLLNGFWSERWVGHWESPSLAVVLLLFDVP